MFVTLLGNILNSNYSVKKKKDTLNLCYQLITFFPIKYIIGTEIDYTISLNVNV